MSVEVLQNSLGLVSLATPLAILLGWPVALTGILWGELGRRWVRVLSLLTLALPPFFVAGMWMEWVGFAGAWRAGTEFLPEKAWPLVMSVIVLALMLWPLATLLNLGVWDRVDARLWEVEPRLRGCDLWKCVLWPALSRGMGIPVLWIGILVLGNFGVPALFQARVWSAEVWVEYATRFDAGSAMKLCWPLALAVGLGLVVLGRAGWDWPAARTRLPAKALKERLGPVLSGGILVLASVVVGVSLGGPVLTALLRGRTWSELIPSFEATGPVAWRTVLYAGVAASVVWLIAAASAGRRGMAVSVVPFAIPGVFTGMFLAEVSSVATVQPLRSTGFWVVAALVIRYTFVGWLVADRAWRTADVRLRDSVASAGGGRWAQWRHVIWPVSRGSLAGVWYAIYVLCLWDVETQLLVVPPGGDTLALMIFNLLHYGHNAQVSALCVQLGLLAILPLGLFTLFRWVTGDFGTGRRIRGLGLLVLAPGLAACSPEDGAKTSARLSSALFEHVEVVGGKGTGPGFFSKPRSVAVDERGQLYVVDMTGRVQRFDEAGRWLSHWQMPETAAGRPKGMDAVPGGGVFVVEPHYHRVNRFDPEGRRTSQWGVQGTEAGQIWFPRAIAVGSDGTCYVSEYGKRERIQRFRWEDGVYLGGFGEEGIGPGQLNRAEGLGIGPNGDVYVADSCNHRIQIFSRDGKLLRMHGRAGRALGEFSYPYDIRVDGEGTQYVCEFGNSRIHILSADDRPLETLGGPGNGPAELNNPWSLCLDSSGDLYVADALNHRVVKYVRRKSGPSLATGRWRSVDGHFGHTGGKG